MCRWIVASIALGTDDGGSIGCSQPLDVDQVLNRHGNAMQRPEGPSQHDVALGATGCRARSLSINLDEGIELQLGLAETHQCGIESLDRRYPVLRDLARQSNGRHAIEL